MKTEKQLSLQAAAEKSNSRFVPFFLQGAVGEKFESDEYLAIVVQ